MSFLKISDPKKRDFIVEEFLKTKKNIQDSYLSERLGDIGIHREMSKLFKPITEAQRDVKGSLPGWQYPPNTTETTHGIPRYQLRLNWFTLFMPRKKKHVNVTIFLPLRFSG